MSLRSFDHNEDYVKDLCLKLNSEPYQDYYFFSILTHETAVLLEDIYVLVLTIVIRELKSISAMGFTKFINDITLDENG